MPPGCGGINVPHECFSAANVRTLCVTTKQIPENVKKKDGVGPKPAPSYVLSSFYSYLLRIYLILT
jgi:hypothetical protein